MPLTGLEPVPRIREHGLSVSCLHSTTGAFFFEHLGGNRTLNDFQILQRSALLCNIIQFVYSDAT